MYEKHFSFKHKPFELVPNPDFLFLSSTHKKALTYLDYGIQEKIGFILLTGEIGSGKTTIIRNLIKNLNASVRLSRINNTKVSSEQLISMINEDFGLEVEGKNKTKLLSDLNEFLIDQYSKKFQPILLIDEAQNLSPDLLEEIRLLSNLETDRAKLLQIMLVGQTELKKTLMLPELMQLRQRININYHITPLTIDETVKYIRHRLTIAGNPDAMRFQGDMPGLIYRFSGGIPRLINILCDFALLTAFTEGEKEINADIIREVAHDLESRDYRNEPQDNTVSLTAKKDESPDLLKEVGNIALRLINLEETIKKNLPEITVLTEKVDRLEKDISELREQVFLKEQL
ncbi:MAG TPA: AAA family ATPase [Nitrospirae bacterium]|nr:AAA family ATPase [Nitrospirota bacterium]